MTQAGELQVGDIIQTYGPNDKWGALWEGKIVEVVSHDFIRVLFKTRPGLDAEDYLSYTTPFDPKWTISGRKGLESWTSEPGWRTLDT